jgi:penicillin-binding protein 1A
MTALALPAFDATASGQFNKAEDISVIFLDRYGNEIGRRGIRSDDSVALDKLPDHLIKATLATEDRRFYEHFGIDVFGTAARLLSNAQGDSSLQGGSSITQQLAKNLFLTRAHHRAQDQGGLPLGLARGALHQGRDPQALFRPRLYGRRQFRRRRPPPNSISARRSPTSPRRAAMLAGLFKAPTKYAPHVDLAAARGRANVVLTNLVDAGF